MKLIGEYPISRIYLIKRIIVRSIIYLQKFLRIINFTIIPKNSHFADVEGLFYEFNVEREIENLIFINKLSEIFRLEKYIDIGGNYGQFCAGVNITKKYVFEPNQKLIPIIKKGNPQAIIHPSGIVIENGSYKYVEVEGNSGANNLIKMEYGDSSEIDTITVNEMLKLTEDNINLSNTIFKIDIEGGEVDIINAIHHQIVKNGLDYPIIAFECLNKNDAFSVMQILTNYNFFHVRFEYQGVKDQNYGSVLSVIKVLLKAKDKLFLEELKLSSVNRDFYSLIFCIPKKYEL